MRPLLGSKKALLILCCVIVTGILVFFVRGQKATAVEYCTGQVETGPLRNVVNATGVVQTVVTVQVGSQVSGQVEELYADYNSVVKRGQLLARLDPRNSQTQVENARANVVAVQARVRSAEAELKTQAANLLSAKANLEAARVTRDNAASQFQRASDLSQSGLTSKNDYDNSKANADSSQAKYEQAQAAVAQADAQSNVSAAGIQQVKAQLEQAQADLSRAALNLGYCNIYSPVDGVVISRNVDVGQTIAASLQSPTLFSIANDLTRMQVDASVDEADIGSISDQADVRFTVDAYPNDVFEGQISEIRLSPQTVQNVVTYSVILSINNSEMKLKPGMTANITLTVDQRRNVMKVPNAALRYAPPGIQRVEGPGHSNRVIEVENPETEEAGPVHNRIEAAPAQLAPGQKWDPNQKIRFVPPRKPVQREGMIWVLNGQKQPEPRNIVLGITDGSVTEVVAGEMRPGDAVIIGDSTQAAGVRPAVPAGPNFRFGGGFGGGGGVFRRGQ